MPAGCNASPSTLSFPRKREPSIPEVTVRGTMGPRFRGDDI